MDTVHLIDHPLVRHHVTILRDRNTPADTFRGAVYRLTFLLAYEATSDFAVREFPVTTPMAETTGQTVRERIGIVPILRAGLGMVDPVVSLIPQTEIWHLGFYRNEETLEPVPYYQKLPNAEPVDVALVTDPMLATGGSACAAIEAITAWGVKRIKLLAIIAAPEGLQRLREQFPDVQIYVCAIDDHLNERGYIVPGLGDAGDRIFNTVRPVTGRS